MGTTFIYDHMKKGDFPKGRKFGRATRWAEVEIDQYCNGTWTPRAGNEAGARSDHSGAACSNRSR
ncbi:helix-turn-helix transcriptional regulator [Pseudomonas aeruginosa]